MNDATKIAAILGTLGVTGALAYWLRDRDDWKAKHAAKGPDLSQIMRVLQPWQRTAWAKRVAQYPNFGSDIGELTRVLAITPAQLQKAGAKPSTIPSGFNPPPGMPIPSDEDVEAAHKGPVFGPDDIDYGPTT